MLKVWVTYPGCKIVSPAGTRVIPTRRHKMVYHGPTAFNNRRLIVEDKNGRIHVVHADIVKFV